MIDVELFEESRITIQKKHYVHRWEGNHIGRKVNRKNDKMDARRPTVVQPSTCSGCSSFGKCFVRPLLSTIYQPNILDAVVKPLNDMASTGFSIRTLRDPKRNAISLGFKRISKDSSQAVVEFWLESFGLFLMVWIGANVQKVSHISGFTLASPYQGIRKVFYTDSRWKDSCRHIDEWPAHLKACI